MDSLITASVPTCIGGSPSFFFACAMDGEAAATIATAKTRAAPKTSQCLGAVRRWINEE